jgi:hypothetical protein
MHGEEVKLTMPAVPQLLRVARLTAAGLAGRLGFNFDEIEGTGSFDASAPKPVPSELSAQILAAVVDEHELTTDGDVMRFRLRKQRVGG